MMLNELYYGELPELRGMNYCLLHYSEFMSNWDFVSFSCVRSLATKSGLSFDAKT